MSEEPTPAKPGPADEGAAGGKRSEAGSSEPAANRAVDRFQIFEKVALDRLSAGSDLTRPASFLPLPIRATALAVLLIVSGGVLWSVLARVPIQVNGTAAILPEETIATIQASTSGILRYQVAGIGAGRLPAAQRQANALLQRYWLTEATVPTNRVPSRARLQELIAAALLPLHGLALVMPESRRSAFDDRGHHETSDPVVHFPRGTILAAIEDPAAHAELNSALLTSLPSETLQSSQANELRDRSKRIAAALELQNGQLAALAKELQDRKQLYKRYQELWKDGYLQSTILLDERSRINGLQEQMNAIRREQISTSINSSEQIYQARQSLVNSGDILNKLEDQLIDYLNKTRLFVPDRGAFIVASNFQIGSRVQQGDEIFSYTSQPPTLPRELPVFLDGPSAQQVETGMDVLLTPQGISRAQYGGIPGRVVKVTRIPLPDDGVLGVVGARSISRSVLQRVSTPYLVRVRLEQAEPLHCGSVLSSLCYRWSSGRQPPHPVRLATLADVQITTRYRRPVEFVMPALRKALGLVVDNP